MECIAADGALNVDVVIDPQYQGQGLGRKIMESLMAWFEQQSPVGAYITLVEDFPERYAKFGFRPVRLARESMTIVWGK